MVELGVHPWLVKEHPSVRTCTCQEVMPRVLKYDKHSTFVDSPAGNLSTEESRRYLF